MSSNPDEGTFDVDGTANEHEIYSDLPLRTKTHDDPLAQEEIANDVDRGIIVNASDMPDELPSEKKRKKKKSKKPASKRGLGKPTGFEEFHADAPLTIEQYQESQEAFNHNIPFVDRILKAIQRFERTRKLSPERRDIFYKYLAYGGIDISPNMFVGAQDAEGMDKDQLSTAKAQANISDETREGIVEATETKTAETATELSQEGSKLRTAEHLAKYVVDFEGTMRGFLSRHAPNIYTFNTIDQVRLMTTTLERFMDYLLLHDVCPEYKAEVLTTRNLCRIATDELWHCAEAQRHLPGDFNIACSTLFGGSYSQNYDGETYWGPTDPDTKVFVGLKPEQATQIMGFGIAGAASESVYQQYLTVTAGATAGQGLMISSSTTEHGFEITRIEHPSKDCIALYRENTSTFRPVGKVFARFFKNPNAPPEDLTDTERAQRSSNDNAIDPTWYHDKQYTFFVESEPILSFLRPGMRVEATIHELNCGVWFFDEVLRVLPSFDLWLENELMLGWKEPRPVAGAPVGVWNVGGVDERDTEIAGGAGGNREGGDVDERGYDGKAGDENDGSGAEHEEDTLHGLSTNDKVIAEHGADPY